MARMLWNATAAVYCRFGMRSAAADRFSISFAQNYDRNNYVLFSNDSSLLTQFLC